MYTYGINNADCIYSLTAAAAFRGSTAVCQGQLIHVCTTSLTTCPLNTYTQQSCLKSPRSLTWSRLQTPEWERNMSFKDWGVTHSCLIEQQAWIWDFVQWHHKDTIGTQLPMAPGIDTTGFLMKAFSLNNENRNHSLFRFNTVAKSRENYTIVVIQIRWLLVFINHGENTKVLKAVRRKGFLLKNKS